MTETDFTEELFREMLRSFKGHLSERMGPLMGRLEALERRQPERGEKGLDGIDGKDGTPGLSVKGEPGDKGDPGKDGAAGAKGDPGNPGKDGKDGAPGLPGKDGEPGRPGENGKDGAPGFDGLKGADGINGKDGSDGIDGKDGAAGLNGKDGAPGINGKDADPEVTKQLIESMLEPMFNKAFDQFAEFGEALDRKFEAARHALFETVTSHLKALPPAPAGKDADPEVILRMVKDAVSLVPAPKDGADGRDGPSLEDLLPMIEGVVAKAAAQIPPGRDGRDAAGKDGKDGLGFDDLRAYKKDARTVVFAFTREDRTKEFEFTFPVMLDAGVFEAGKSYEEGDCPTYGGSIYVANRQTLPAERPGDGSDAFRLAVKRGKDGKDAA